MNEDQIKEALSDIGLRLEQDFAVPINGETRPLPYAVLRATINLDASDDGAVGLAIYNYTLALFEANKDLSREEQVLSVLSSNSPVAVTRYPDSSPYQTNFEFSITRKFRR